MNLKGIKLTWLGHATFRIQTPGGKIILIDPWVMNNPMCPENEKTLKHLDVMLCTHAFRNWRAGSRKKASRT